MALFPGHALSQLSSRLRDASFRHEADVWTELDDCGITPRQLVAGLHVTVTRANDDRRFLAAECYARLLSAPEASPRHLLHPIVLGAALLAVKRRTVSVEADADPEAIPEDGDGGEIAAVEEAEEEQEETKATKKEKTTKAHKGGKPKKGTAKGGATAGETIASPEVVAASLEAFVEMASKVSLAEFQDSISHAADAFATLLQEPNVPPAGGQQQGRRRAGKGAGEWCAVSEMAVRGLQELLNERHGNVADTAQLILKALLPAVLMTYAGTTHTPIPAPLVATSTRASRLIASIAARDDATSESSGIMLQHVCVGAAAARKVDYREQAASAIVEIVPALKQAPPHREHFVQFVCKLSKSTTPHNRLFACELAPKLLIDIPSTLGASAIADIAGVLIQRSSDKIVSVRAKAISSLATMLEEAAGGKGDAQTAAAVRERVVPGIIQQFAQADDASFLSRPAAAGEDSAASVVEVLQRRAADQKSAIVRKAALQALVALVSLARASGDAATPAQIKSLGLAVGRLLLEHCTDPSLLVRRQCLSALTTLAQEAAGRQEEGAPLSPEVKLWIQAALPMTADPEQTAQEQALDAVDAVLLQPIAKRGGGSGEAWAALEAIGETELQRALQRACGVLESKKRASKELVRGLQAGVAKVPPSPNKGAWLLLSELAPSHAKHLDPTPLLECWASVRDAADFIQRSEQVYVRLVRVVSVVAAKQLPRKDTAELAADIKKKLHSFAFPPSVIQGFVRALTAICGSAGADEWHDLLRLCDERLSSFVVDPPAEIQPEDEEGIAWRLFTLGEIAVIARKSVPDRLVTSVEALASQELSLSGQQKKSVSLPPSIRAHAFVALGKLCLENERLAKRCIAMFSRELLRGASPIIRNNAMVVMCDLCIRYTGLVDSHVPNMALCLADQSKLVRQQSLLLITRLLQESFLKIRGPIFFYMLRLVADNDAVLAQQARQCISSLFREKLESLTFFNFFVEAVFHLNNYTGHPVYNQLRAFHPGVEPSAFAFANSLVGDGEKRRKRFQLYALLLSGMNSEHKLQVTLKLTQEVLAAVADGELPLTAASDVVSDTLAILASKEIKVGSASGPDDEDAVAPEKPEPTVAAAAGPPPEGAAAAAAAKGALLGKIARKNVVENIVPIAVELKRFFEREHSPLLRSLTLFFKALTQDYKKEMQDILDANKQLAEEIEYDLRQLKAPSVAVAQSPARGIISTAKSPRQAPVAQMFSPSTSSSRGDIAKFSVPRLRPSMARTSQLRPQPAAEPRPAEIPKEAEPATSATTGTTTDATVDITLPSPFKKVPPPRVWPVTVPPRSRTTDGEGDDESETPVEASQAPKPKPRATRSKKVTSKGKKKAKEDDDELEEEPEEEEDEPKERPKGRKKKGEAGKIPRKKRAVK